MDTPSFAIILGDAFFYDADGTALFQIPKTYYVKVLEEGTLCLVEYGLTPIQGYCKAEDLTFVDYVPTRPYPEIEFDLVYELSTPVPSPLSTRTVHATYYGDFSIGSLTYCYAGTDDGRGLVPRPPFLLEENTDYHPKEEELSLPIPLIVGASFTVLLFLALLLALHSRRKEYTDEEGYSL